VYEEAALTVRVARDNAIFEKARQRQDSGKTEKNPIDKERLKEKNQTLGRRFLRNRVCG
jgi:hypothetical protein